MSLNKLEKRVKLATKSDKADIIIWLFAKVAEKIDTL